MKCSKYNKTTTPLSYWLPTLVEVNEPYEYEFEDILNSIFGASIQTEWIADFNEVGTGCFYLFLIYEKGFKPTAKEIEEAVEEFTPDDVKEARELKIEWRVWKK